MYRLLIAEDEQAFVNLLVKAYPWHEKGIDVIGAAVGSEALDMIGRMHPDVVMTEMRMKGTSGAELMEQAAKLPLPPQFIVLSGCTEFLAVRQAMQAGAIAYCLKPLDKNEMDRALDSAILHLENARALRMAAWQQFLIHQEEESEKRLLALCGCAGQYTLVLAEGAAEEMLKSVGGVTLKLSKGCLLGFLRGDGKALEAPEFKSAMLSALAAGKVISFVYTTPDKEKNHLNESLVMLADALYAYWMTGQTPCFGRIFNMPRQENAALKHLTQLCNKNRSSAAVQCLEEMSKDKKGLTVTEAMQAENLCLSMLSRMRNEPPPVPMQFGWQLTERHASFYEEVRDLRRCFGRANGMVCDVETLHNETLQRIVAELNGRFMTPVSFREIAARFMINPSYLSQLFKRELGVTFTAYVSTLRINYAMEMLDKTGLPVGTVGEKAGFENYLTFTKLFKRETGMTPREYRTRSVNSEFC